MNPVELENDCSKWLRPSIGCSFDLSDEETAALLNLLVETIEADN
jgi:hypothetical protein